MQRAVANPVLELKDLSGFLAEMSQPRTHETHSGQKRGDVAAVVGIAEPTATSLQLRLAELRAAEVPLMQPAGEPGACLHARQRSGTIDAVTASEPADVKLPAGRPRTAAVTMAAEESAEAAQAAEAEPAEAPAQKGRGRPAGSKNKPKVVQMTAVQEPAEPPRASPPPAQVECIAAVMIRSLRA